jgi:hypothetical protein
VTDDENSVVHHVNSVESFWKLFKASVRSTHIHVSAKQAMLYLPYPPDMEPDLNQTVVRI